MLYTAPVMSAFPLYYLFLLRRAGRNGHVANISIKWTKGLLVTVLLTRWDNPSEACPAFRGMKGMICTVGALSLLQSARGQEGLVIEWKPFFSTA